MAVVARDSACQGAYKMIGRIMRVFRKTSEMREMSERYCSELQFGGEFMVCKSIMAFVPVAGGGWDVIWGIIGE